MKKVWDERVKTLLKSCQDLLAKIEEYKAKDLAHVTSNLFVDKEKSEVVFANLNYTSNEVHKLKIEIEKTKHAYESIE